jgi:phosphoheptose isomerase
LNDRHTNPSVTVIIPTLNERDNLAHVLPHIPSEVTEVILVDGHSTDGTVEAALEILPRIKVVHQDGRGKGNALRSGFHAATGDIIVMLDADGSTDPGEIPRFVHALLAGADFAKGSRFLHGGGTSDMPFHRRWGNLTFVRMVRWLYGGKFTDLCYGYNAFWRDVLPVLDLDGDGFEIETMMNIRALRSRLRIVEVPSFEDRRVMGVGRLRTIPDGWRVLRTIWSERSRRVAPWDASLRYTATRWTPIAIVPESAVRGSHDGNGHAPVNSNGNGSDNGNGAGMGDYPPHSPPLQVVAEARQVMELHPPHAPGGDADAMGDSWQAAAQEYILRLSGILHAVDLESVGRVVEVLRGARDRNSTIFIAGNGGSSATAAHWVNDLGKAARRSGRAPMRVMNLTDNVPWLTALGNDEGFDRVFVGQLENFAQQGDVLVVISASGQSPNVLEALRFARERGMVTVGLIGFDGGQALSMLDEPVWIRTEQGAYGLVETAHSAVADIVTTCLIDDHAPVASSAH